MIDWGVIRQLLHPPAWLLYTWLVMLGESVLGRGYGCIVRSPPGFACDRVFALPMPIGSVYPIRATLGWFLPAGLLFLLVHSLREAYDESMKGVLDRFFGRIVHADPFALFGTVDQRGLRLPGWAPLPDGFELGAFDEGAFHDQAERAFVLVQQAWARQQPMVARSVVSPTSWTELSALIDASRHYRREGILLVGLEIVDGRILKSGFLDGQEAVTVRLDVRCQDPPTDGRQDWTFARPREGAWQVVAVEPVSLDKKSRPPNNGGRLERT